MLHGLLCVDKIIYVQYVVEMAKNRCAMMDPPWLERGGGKNKRGADRHYPLMPFRDIVRTLQEPMSTVGPDAHCWVWVTDNFLRDGLGILDTFGFRYIRTLQWTKMRDAPHPHYSAYGANLAAMAGLQKGLGQYLRGSHEMALLGVRGKAMLPAPKVRRPSVVFAERTKHSRKPDEAVEVIEARSPGPRLEIFAREPRDGWAVWGDEV